MPESKSGALDQLGESPINIFMHNYYELDLPIELLDEGRVFLNNQDMLPTPAEKFPWRLKFKNPNLFIKDKTLEYFKSINLILEDEVMIFRGDPFARQAIHIDSMSPGYGINIVWGSRASEMVWYDPLISLEESTLMYSTANSPYYYFKQHQVKEIERATIKGPCLVRTDIPHNSINYDLINFRWCLSIRFTGPAKSWGEAVEFFKPYFVK